MFHRPLIGTVRMIVPTAERLGVAPTSERQRTERVFSRSEASVLLQTADASEDPDRRRQIVEPAQRASSAPVVTYIPSPLITVLIEAHVTSIVNAQRRGSFVEVAREVELDRYRA